MDGSVADLSKYRLEKAKEDLKCYPAFSMVPEAPCFRQNQETPVAEIAMYFPSQSLRRESFLLTLCSTSIIDKKRDRTSTLASSRSCLFPPKEQSPLSR